MLFSSQAYHEIEEGVLVGCTGKAYLATRLQCSVKGVLCASRLLIKSTAGVLAALRGSRSAVSTRTSPIAAVFMDSLRVMLQESVRNRISRSRQAKKCVTNMPGECSPIDMKLEAGV